MTTVFRSVAGKRLLFRPLTGTSVAPPCIGIACAAKGDVTPIRKNFAKSCGDFPAIPRASSASKVGTRPVFLFAGDGARLPEFRLLQMSVHEIACRRDYRCRENHGLSPCLPNPWRQSAFLARGGYTIENADQLLHDLRTQPLLLDATPLHSTEFGQFYEIRGPLVGPNGVTLQIRSIWMKENVSGVTKFITLIPEK